MSLAAIIDRDPGHDDVMAILLGGRLLDLRAITTVHGNASLEHTTINARTTVEFADLRRIRTDRPVAEGAPANDEVAVAVDVERFWSRFLEVLATYP